VVRPCTLSVVSPRLEIQVGLAPVRFGAKPVFKFFFNQVTLLFSQSLKTKKTPINRSPKRWVHTLLGSGGPHLCTVRRSSPTLVSRVPVSGVWYVPANNADANAEPTNRESAEGRNSVRGGITASQEWTKSAATTKAGRDEFVGGNKLYRRGLHDTE
jgi:hypothetical protein